MKFIRGNGQHVITHASYEAPKITRPFFHSYTVMRILGTQIVSEIEQANTITRLKRQIRLRKFALKLLKDKIAEFCIILVANQVVLLNVGRNEYNAFKTWLPTAVTSKQYEQINNLGSLRDFIREAHRMYWIIDAANRGVGTTQPTAWVA